MKIINHDIVTKVGKRVGSPSAGLITYCYWLSRLTYSPLSVSYLPLDSWLRAVHNKMVDIEDLKQGLQCIPIWCRVSFHWITSLGSGAPLVCCSDPTEEGLAPLSELGSSIGWPSSVITGIVITLPLPTVVSISRHFVFSFSYSNLSKYENQYIPCPIAYDV